MNNNILSGKVVKFLLGGGVATAINLLLIFLLIEKLGFDTPFLRNVANIISIELSLIASFFIYRIWVWRGGNWNWFNVLFKQLPLYHVSAGTAIVVRVFFVFPLLDFWGVSYSVNTVFGALISASLNFIISDRFVFTSSKNQGKEAYFPEALTPALLPDSSPTRPLAPKFGEIRPPAPKSGEIRPPAPKSGGVEREVPIIGDLGAKINLFSLVIPAHNEEDCIVNTIHNISEHLDQASINYEILVVNDNSKDKTENLLQELHEENPRVHYINNYYPNGFGFAVRCGLENFNGDAVAIVMADNSDSPENMIDYYNKMQEGYDCVFGSRFIKGGKVINYPFYKLIINRMANLFISVLFGLNFNDTTNAFKMYRKEVIEGISPLLSHHFNLTVELPLKSIVRGYSYAIIPITWRNRSAGVSKLKLKEMGSRYLFIVLYTLLEKHLSRGDYQRKETPIKVKSSD
ncbi:MAG: glycosyltransferase [Cyanobacteria bacterium]|nr:glycosyltransferase [Cyanobacteria bacterium CG_2015-16_32_12]NCO78639.1 glycosyltransferase [Cyanobacteria bacterium CG_2015-22_32_23]NCQ03356.1 glycosyltransferase [Cyanobacteria bacterium CG_2015-09_32_10]NCQ41817.1 glycosyltransferase [Cyanobacteria bacterium CG_2015-04_32_10]NCS85987.1 glycosyltransferase [Cyanobacteria bacterium CG_2015-02_32_10]